MAFEEDSISSENEHVPCQGGWKIMFPFPYRSCYTSAVDGAVLMSFFCKSIAHVAEGCENT